MTEQPGPGHMVMAAARTMARRRMGACETTPPASTGNQHATPDNPTATGPSSLLRIFRRMPGQARSSSPLRGCGRSSLTPGRAAGRPGQLRGRIQKNSQPSPAARVVTGPDPYALLTVVALMGGCRDAAPVAGRVTSAEACGAPDEVPGAVEAALGMSEDATGMLLSYNRNQQRPSMRSAPRASGPPRIAASYPAASSRNRNLGDQRFVRYVSERRLFPPRRRAPRARSPSPIPAVPGPS
jgi:hypothetical protein